MKIDSRQILLLQFLAALLALLVALVSQYLFLLHPCELCIFQRYPYLAIVIISISTFLFVRQKYFLVFSVICAGLFFIDAGLAFYHAGVEMDIFQGPDACSNTASGEQTLEELRAAIMNAPLVSCKQAMAYFLGLSMAAWNGIYASFFAILSVVGVRHVIASRRD